KAPVFYLNCFHEFQKEYNEVANIQKNGCLEIARELFFTFVLNLYRFLDKYTDNRKKNGP
nr:hypothetical protein [Bacteroidales bacterium]